MADEQTTDIVEMTAEQEREAFFAIQAGPKGLEIKSAGELYSFAKMLSKSQFAPKGMEKPQDLFIAMCHGRSIGIQDPLLATQTIAVVNGRPTIWGDGFLGLIQSSGLLEFQDEHYEGDEGTDDFRAVCVLRRIGNESEFRNEYSIRDAKAAGLWGKQGPWTTNPKRMLKMRARAFSGRDGFSDVLKGLSMREEVEDYIDVTATPVEPQTVSSRLDAFVAQHDARSNGNVPPSVGESAELLPSQTKPTTPPETPDKPKRKRGRPRKDKPKPEPVPAGDDKELF